MWWLLQPLISVWLQWCIPSGAGACDSAHCEGCLTALGERVGVGLDWSLLHGHPSWMENIDACLSCYSPCPLSLFLGIVIGWMGLSGVRARRPRYNNSLCHIKGQSLEPCEGVSQLVTTTEAHHPSTVNTQHTSFDRLHTNRLRNSCKSHTSLIVNTCFLKCQDVKWFILYLIKQWQDCECC